MRINFILNAIKLRKLKKKNLKQNGGHYEKDKKSHNSTLTILPSRTFATNASTLSIKNLKKEVLTADTTSIKEESNWVNLIDYNKVPNDIRWTVNNFKPKNNKNKKKALEEVIKTMYSFNLTYGGDKLKQEEMINKNTKCLGFTLLTSKLLDKSDIEYRYIYLKSQNIDYYDHVAILVNIENKWYYLETTWFDKKYKNYNLKTNEYLIDIDKETSSMSEVFVTSSSQNGKTLDPCGLLYIK